MNSILEFIDPKAIRDNNSQLANAILDSYQSHDVMMSTFMSIQQF